MRAADTDEVRRKASALKRITSAAGVAFRTMGAQVCIRNNLGLKTRMRWLQLPCDRPMWMPALEYGTQSSGMRGALALAGA